VKQDEVSVGALREQDSSQQQSGKQGARRTDFPVHTHRQIPLGRQLNHYIDSVTSIEFGREPLLFLKDQLNAGHPLRSERISDPRQGRAWLQNLDGDNRDVILLSH